MRAIPENHWSSHLFATTVLGLAWLIARANRSIMGQTRTANRAHAATVQALGLKNQSDRELAIERITQVMITEWELGNFDMARYEERVLRVLEEMSDEEFETTYKDPYT